MAREGEGPNGLFDGPRSLFGGYQPARTNVILVGDGDAHGREANRSVTATDVQGSGFCYRRSGCRHRSTADAARQLIWVGWGDVLGLDRLFLVRRARGRNTEAPGLELRRHLRDVGWLGVGMAILAADAFTSRQAWVWWSIAASFALWYPSIPAAPFTASTPMLASTRSSWWPSRSRFWAHSASSRELKIRGPHELRSGGGVARYTTPDAKVRVSRSLSPIGRWSFGKNGVPARGRQDGRAAGTRR